MSIDDVLDIYSPSLLAAFMLSSLFFLLYGVINLIDTNNYIKEFNILDIGTVNRGSLIYAYVAGYYMFVLKVIIALVTIFVLTLIIRIAVTTMIGIFTNKQTGGDSRKIMHGAAFSVANKIEEAVFGNMRYLLSFMTTGTFVIIFLILIPLFLFFFMLVYVRFFNVEVINEENLNESPKIMITYHHSMMYLLTSFFLVAFLFSLYIWFKKTYKK